MRYSLRVLCVLGSVTVLPGAAAAVEFASHLGQFPPIDNPKCTCRYKGEHVELGAMRCLQTPEGPRMAQCVTEQNVTSWRPSHDSCPQAMLFTPRG